MNYWDLAVTLALVAILYVWAYNVNLRRRR